ncbi:MAG: hypothetical protein LBG65_02090 [Puniceicoccales bacterium]|jgi:hypothetical protein|nr:hypothetical protein [Puniceicoccales bacterium]
MKTKIKTTTVLLALSISSPRGFAQYAGEELPAAYVSTPTIPSDNVRNLAQIF